MKHRWLGPWRASVDSCTNAVFDGDDTALGGEQRDQRIQEHRLARARTPPRDQDVAPATWTRGWIDNSSD